MPAIFKTAKVNKTVYVRCSTYKMCSRVIFICLKNKVQTTEKQGGSTAIYVEKTESKSHQKVS